MDLVDALPNYTASHHTRKEYSAIPPLQNLEIHIEIKHLEKSQSVIYNLSCLTHLSADVNRNVM